MSTPTGHFPPKAIVLKKIHRRWGQKPFCFFIPFILMSPLLSTPVRGEEIFMRISGVTGGSTDAEHVGWISVDSLNYGVSRPIASGAGGITKPVQGNMVVSFAMDKSIPSLYQSICQDTTIPRVDIEFDKASPTTIQFYKVTLNNVILTGVNTGSGSHWSDVSLAMYYNQIIWTYTQVDAPGQPAYTTTWDFTSSKGNNGVALTDSDFDSLPDDWEMANFGTLIYGPDDDPDHDGLNNYQEFIAGTDPNNSDSVLRVTGINLTDGDVHLAWNSVAGKTYTIYGATRVDGPYTPVLTVLAADNGETSTNFPPSIYQFYRVAIPAN